MPSLFGLDIAGIVNDAFTQAGGVLDATLTKVEPGTRTPGDLAGGTNSTSTAHACKGFVEQRTSRRMGDTLVQVAGEYVSILGASLPAGVEPEPSDSVTIEGRTFVVIEVTERDPAAALYVLRVEG